MEQLPFEFIIQHLFFLISKLNIMKHFLSWAKNSIDNEILYINKMQAEINNICLFTINCGTRETKMGEMNADRK